jgi:hypothetical protein
MKGIWLVKNSIAPIGFVLLATYARRVLIETDGILDLK